jgi:hypothetical protein
VEKKRVLDMKNKLLPKIMICCILLNCCAISGVQGLYHVYLILDDTGSGFIYMDGNYSSERHDRFISGTFPTNPIPNPTFIFSDFESQLAGVGWQTNIKQKKAALISPQHFLNANHWKLSGTITFYNQCGELKTYDVESNTQIADTDIAIGRLSEPIPPEDHIPYYPILSVTYYDYFYKIVMYVGRGADNYDFAAGIRRINGFQSSGIYPNSFIYHNYLPTLPDGFTVDDIVKGVTYDSGSPSFIFDDGELSLVGHHWAVSHDPFLGYYRDEVDALLAADGYSLAVLDEGDVVDPPCPCGGDPSHFDLLFDYVIKDGYQSHPAIHTMDYFRRYYSSNP